MAKETASPITIPIPVPKPENAVFIFCILFSKIFEAHRSSRSQTTILNEGELAERKPFDRVLRLKGMALKCSSQRT